MNVHVRLFAGLRDVIGRPTLSLELDNGSTVRELRDALSRDFPTITPFLPTLVFAVDDEYVTEEARLSDGAEVSLIPPVSGGAGLIAVTDNTLDADALIASVRRDESGAVVLFSGVARNHSEGRRVRALEYEAHASMAEKKLREVADEVGARFAISDIGVLHRTGHLEIGETSLLVAVSAPHRKEAFEAAQYAVDRIKQTVPVWKKEVWEDGGGAAWVKGHTVDLPERAGAS